MSQVQADYILVPLNPANAKKIAHKLFLTFSGQTGSVKAGLTIPTKNLEIYGQIKEAAETAVVQTKKLIELGKYLEKRGLAGKVLSNVLAKDMKAVRTAAENLYIAAARYPNLALVPNNGNKAVPVPVHAQNYGGWYKAIYRDLLDLMKKYGEIVYDRQHQKLSFWTEDVNLFGVDFGKYHIVINLNRLPLKKGSDEETAKDVFRIYSNRAVPSGVSPTIIHPHVSQNIMCQGDMRNVIKAAFTEGRIYDAVLAINSVLNNYNGSSAYAQLELWAQGVLREYHLAQMTEELKERMVRFKVVTTAQPAGAISFGSLTVNKIIEIGSETSQVPVTAARTQTGFLGEQTSTPTMSEGEIFGAAPVELPQTASPVQPVQPIATPLELITEIEFTATPAAWCVVCRDFITEELVRHRCTRCAEPFCTNHRAQNTDEEICQNCAQLPQESVNGPSQQAQEAGV
jgi:hypothetical protein